VPPDVSAVGEDIPDLDGTLVEGTSFAAPQIAGLISYLWLLSDDLRLTQPMQVTRQAVLSNARTTAAGPVVDAYAATLSLDPVVGDPEPATWKVRFSLLDVNNDNKFDENDIQLFLSHLYFVDPATGTITTAPPSNASADYSRFDLNGDGFTTSSSRRERFDLDRVGSTLYGPANYSTVSQDIEGHQVSFDETGLTDTEILCYYAYSTMYQGDTDARKSLLAGRCGLSVQPASANIATGQQQTFTASAPNNDPVTWGVSPGCGTIGENTGIFTASTPGTCTVTATSGVDPSQSGKATVTVVASSPTTGNITFAPFYDGTYDCTITGLAGDIQPCGGPFPLRRLVNFSFVSQTTGSLFAPQDGCTYRVQVDRTTGAFTGTVDGCTTVPAIALSCDPPYRTVDGVFGNDALVFKEVQRLNADQCSRSGEVITYTLRACSPGAGTCSAPIQ
jgi:hypothetical protein